MAAQTDRLLGRAQGSGSARSTDPPPQFHWEAITLTSWHSLHSSWVCFFASGRVKREEAKEVRAPAATDVLPVDGSGGTRREAPAANIRLAQGYFDMLTTYETCRVLYPNSDP